MAFPGAEAADFLARAVPWPLVLAGFTLLGVWIGFRSRIDVFADTGLRMQDALLIVLGPIAGLAVNVPLFPVNGTWIAINLGGGLLPLVIAGLWLVRTPRHSKVPIVLLSLAGTVLVAVVSNRIVAFDPSTGIFAEFPLFFLPAITAAGFGLAVSVPRLTRALPIAFISGSMGALIGADMLNMPVILRHLASRNELGVVSIGGAGVLDMVPLTGLMAMVLTATLVVAAKARPALHAPPPSTIPPPPDPRAAWLRFRTLADPGPRDKAIAASALSDLHLYRGRYGKSVANANRAVQFYLEAIRGAVPAAGLEPSLARDVELLERAAERARLGSADRVLAGNANRACKLVLARLERSSEHPRGGSP